MIKRRQFKMAITKLLVAKALLYALLAGMFLNQLRISAGKLADGVQKTLISRWSSLHGCKKLYCKT